MKLRLKALRSLRLNYKRRGVWVWLKGRQRVTCPACLGAKRTPHPSKRGWTLICVECLEQGFVNPRGYQRILSEPRAVLNEQRALADGVMG